MAEKPELSGRRISPRLAIGLFALVCAALAASYWWFLRVDYTVLYSGLKQTEASAIVGQLEAKGISHRLRDDGTTILVPTPDADRVRLSVAGSDLPMKGAVGFELFNKADMGLTDFAQKINYQRALQGELTRTIMMIDGVETARVHLAIPERSLFRSGQATPKAAVEVVPKPGRTLSQEQIAGIQQLVAGAVPELPLEAVSVLDGNGRVVSRAQAASQASGEPDERTALQSYYSARAKAALAERMPGVAFEVRVLILQSAQAGSVTAPFDPSGSAPDTNGQVSRRDFQLRATLFSVPPLTPADQQIAIEVASVAIGLAPQNGDTIAFEAGPMPKAPPRQDFASPVRLDTTDAVLDEKPVENIAIPWWWALVGGAAVAVLLALVLIRRRRSGPDTGAFVARVRAQAAASLHAQP